MQKSKRQPKSKLSKPPKLAPDRALHLAWKRGLLEYKLHSAQKLIDDAVNASPGKLYVVNVSRQFGKSYWAVTKAIKTAIRKPNSVIKLATAFLTDLEEFILPAFDKVLEDCPDEMRPRFKTHGSKWVFPNGSQIKLIGLDRKPNGLRGNTIDLIIIDEAGFVKNLNYLYKSVIIPATMHRPDAKVIFTSTPPESPDHPFADFCARAMIEKCYSHFTIYDNPMVTPEIIEELAKESGGYTSITWRREYMAELIIDAERAIIPEWKDEYIQEAPHNSYFGYWHRYVGMDLGVRDFTAVLFGHYNFQESTLYIEDELTINGPEMTTEVLKAEIMAKEKLVFGNLPAYRRISDNNNLMLLNDLRTLHGLSFTPVTKTTLDAMVNELRMYVGQGRIKINPKCEKTIGCLRFGVWNEKRDKFARSNTYKHFDHLAALIYLLRHVDKHSNPVPFTHKMTENTHYIPDAQQNNKNLQTIKKLFGKNF